MPSVSGEPSKSSQPSSKPSLSPSESSKPSSGPSSMPSTSPMASCSPGDLSLGDKCSDAANDNGDCDCCPSGAGDRNCPGGAGRFCGTGNVCP
eukprot:scaffold8146_cov76-Skeletonema_dohrnii-CCMP3373.AAC.1